MPKLTDETSMAADPLAARRCRKVIEFTGGAGLGAVGTVALFTVTGAVLVRIAAVCTEDLTEAAPTATLSLGTAANPATIIAGTNAVNIDVGEVWIDATPAVIKSWAVVIAYVIGDGADIVATVGAQNITDGTMEFDCFWTPITANGFVGPA